MSANADRKSPEKKEVAEPRTNKKTTDYNQSEKAPKKQKRIQQKTHQNNQPTTATKTTQKAPLKIVQMQ